MKYFILCLPLFLAPSPVLSFAVPSSAEHHDVGYSDNSIQSRRSVFKAGSVIATALMTNGLSPCPEAQADEGKIYSANARNMARLNAGDSSGGSVYDNNPSSPKARTRRAMVGCKNSSARSLAGDGIGDKELSEKDCNMLVMGGDADFMLQALAELDCPTCPYGIGSR